MYFKDDGSKHVANVWNLTLELDLKQVFKYIYRSVLFDFHVHDMF